MSYYLKNVLLLYTDKYYFVKQVYPYGLDLIANYLRQYGYDVTIDYPFLPEPELETNLEQILSRTEPDLIGLGIRNLDTAMSCEPFGDYEGTDYKTFYFIPEIKRIVDIIKQLRPQVPVVIGGGGFTISPEAILKRLGVEYGITGEGEEPLRQFLEAFPNEDKISKVPNLVFWRREDFITNPQEPYVFEKDRGGVEREKKFNYAYETVGMPVQVKRGCNRNCSYCVEPLIEGRKLVFKDPDAVIGELKFIAETYDDVRNIFFVDTEFNIPDLEYCTVLIRKILDSGLHEHFLFSSQFLPAPFDREFVKLLADTGFSVVLTCDSFADSVLEKNKVAYRQKESVETIALCDEFDLDCTISLIFGLPGETYETIDHTIALMVKYPPGALRRYEYTIGGRVYQGTPLCCFVEARETDHQVYGTRSKGFLEPYYFCSPERPLKVKTYVEQQFPFPTAYQKINDDIVHQRLAMAYLIDQSRWDQAVEKFSESDLDACSSIYDYFFRKLADAGEVETAKAVSEHFMEAILQSGEKDKYGDQIPVIQYYMNLLNPNFS
ncbi:B12-binding domain-containing radical SAM protein [Thermodesulfobacteriota bacterium]